MAARTLRHLRALSKWHRALPEWQCIEQRRFASTRGVVYYQSSKVPTSVLSTGSVGTNRDLLGSDGEFFGTDPQEIEVDMEDGRGKGYSLDENGFCLMDHAWDHVDYYDNDAVVNRYYAECEDIVRRATGASKVIAFDHNLRATQRKKDGQSMKGGNAIQEPLIGYGVHNDYTMTSAPRRIQQLAEPPSKNDTRKEDCRLRPEDVEVLLKGRWLFVNVWRNISNHPVEKFPLAACDAKSVVLDDLVVFEIRYSDRIGENYFVSSKRYESHRWVYFPRMTKDEVFLLKCWDSRGRDFLEGSSAAVPATFSLHTGFVDRASPPSAPDRESLEVRLMAFFQE